MAGESEFGDAEVISVEYDGGLATSGQLHFYEYGRASYAFARLVATIELFRRTGRVAERISSRSYVDIIIRAPEKGSFPIGILIPVAMELVKEAPKFAQISIGVFLKFVAHLVTRLLPKEENTILELAKLEIRREEERTKQSGEETKRLREIRKMKETSNVTSPTAIDVLGSTLKSTDQRNAQLGENQQTLSKLATKLIEYEEGEREFEPYKHQLESIGQERLVRLTRKIRPQLAEMGVPLRKSATQVRFSTGTKRQMFATYDQESISDINSRILDAQTSTVELRMTAYDRDTGAGKCDVLPDDLRRVSFTVPVQLRSLLRTKVLRGIDQDAVIASVRFFRNQDGRVTSLLLEDVLLEDFLEADEADED